MEIQKSAMLSQPPTVSLQCPQGRDYTMLVTQTKMVYDNLLADKYGKLMDALLQKKAQYDAQCNQLEQKDAQKALEYGIKAQDALNRMSQEAENELKALHMDYQAKMHKMTEQMEMQWKQKNM